MIREITGRQLTAPAVRMQAVAADGMFAAGV